MIRMIAAIDQNGLIGNKNKLPWNIPEDLKRFKELTLNQTIVMGRKTFESLPGKLPNRNHVILTKSKNYAPEGVRVLTELGKVRWFYDDFWVIGGSQIYKQFLPFADEIYLTIVKGSYEGDAYFPYIPFWEYNIRRDGSGPNYEFIILRRNK